MSEVSDFSPHGLQHARLLCPPLSPRICSDPCPWSGWCYLTVSFSAASLSFCLQSFPASAFFSPNTCLYYNFSYIFLCFNTSFKKLLYPLLLFYGCCYSNPWKSLFSSAPKCILNIPFSPCTRRCPHLPPCQPRPGLWAILISQMDLQCCFLPTDCLSDAAACSLFSLLSFLFQPLPTLWPGWFF